LVVAVDEEKGYIDLSNKYITDRDSAIEHYNKYKHVLSVFKQFVYRLGKMLDRELNEEEILEYAEKVLWRFDKRDAYSEFSKIRIDLDGIDQFDLVDEEREVLKSVIIKMFKEPVYTIQARFNMFIIGTSGIERIKTILAYADSCSRDGVELVITMLTSPCYQIEVKGANEKLAVCVVREALDIIEKMVADERGSYKLLKFISTNSLITDHVDIDRMESIAEESEGEEESEDGE
jgi:translation initiation factor 2 alpha subunit (eIF-2alpha)